MLTVRGIDTGGVVGLVYIQVKTLNLGSLVNFLTSTIFWIFSKGTARYMLTNM